MVHVKKYRTIFNLLSGLGVFLFWPLFSAVFLWENYISLGKGQALTEPTRAHIIFRIPEIEKRSNKIFSDFMVTIFIGKNTSMWKSTKLFLKSKSLQFLCCLFFWLTFIDVKKYRTIFFPLLDWVINGSCQKVQNYF